MRVIMSGPLVSILTRRDAAEQRISASVQKVVGIFAAGDLDRDFLIGGAFEDFRASQACGLRERVDLVGESVCMSRVEAPEEGAGGGGLVNAERTIRCREADTGRFQWCVGRLAREASQCGGEAVEVLGFTEDQHHRVEVAREESDAEHQVITSSTSVAWQSSSEPGSPFGTSTRRTLAHSSLTSSSTSAVMPPTRRNLLPTATEESSIIQVGLTSEEDAEVLGHQHILLQDQFAPGDLPRRTDPPQLIRPTPDEGEILVFDAVLVDQETTSCRYLLSVFH